MNSETTMIYDDVQNRWLVDLNNRFYGLHCGECFDLVIGNDRIPCRLELDRDWFVIIQDVRMNLRTQDSYKVII